MGVDPVSFEANLDMYATYLRILSHTDILLFYGLFVLFHACLTVLWDLKVQFCVLFQCLWIICIMQINIKKWCELSDPDQVVFSAKSERMMRIRLDPDPQHMYLYGTSRYSRIEASES